MGTTTMMMMTPTPMMTSQRRRNVLAHVTALKEFSVPQCDKQKCEGCCECTGACPPTEPPAVLKCDDTCYTKKGVLNPSKQCSKDKCNNCCECTGECQNWDDLEDDEKGIEISDEHQPVYECAKWCYSKKHKPKPWVEKKCLWFACSTCPECATPECDGKKC